MIKNPISGKETSTDISKSNRLLSEKSPYLLQHAYNPVHWYPWGEEAFQAAAKEDKPIFLSVGYSTCHWCHVMAHESFEDEAVAALMNQAFICIKVDREERPDIDQMYMSVGPGHDRQRWLASYYYHDAGEKALLCRHLHPQDGTLRPGGNDGDHPPDPRTLEQKQR